MRWHNPRRYDRGPLIMSSTSFAPLDTQQIRMENFMRLSRRGMLIAVGMHAVFAVFGWFLAPILFYLQIVSIAAYGICYRLSLRGHNKVIHAIVLADLLGHSTLAGWLVGIEAGFQYYSWILLPLTFTNREFSQRERLHRAVVLCAMFLFIEWALRHTTPLVAVSAAGLEAMRFFNILCFLTATTSAASQFTQAAENAEAKLRRAAGTDALTGLLNRRRMADRMRQVANALSDQRRAVSVMLLDIDHFKAINDHYGHAAGDEVLVRVGYVLQHAVRQDDLVARWGGEEFLVLLPHATLAESYEIAERIRQEIAGMLFGTDQAIRASVTVGVATWHERERLDATIHRADILLYDGKRRGRNCVVLETGAFVARHQLAS